MSKDALEAALQKTRDIEDKKKKRMELAEKAGLIAGVLVSICIDATIVWLIIKFMVGATSFTWLAALGILMLANLVFSKIKS